MVDEQQHLQDMRLGDQYNRALRERSPQRQPATESSAAPFYRTYTPATDDNGGGSSGANKPNAGNPSGPQSSPSQTTASTPPTASASRLSAETVGQVKSLLQQGYRVGIEHADQRRFRTNAWQSGAAIQTHDPQAAIALIEEYLGKLANEYVRLIGIDPDKRQRVLEQVIQRPSPPSY
ncbi:MAG: ribulose bisphosphate carboxylase small subunit [Leptolyngbyaceae cyanobacterium]